MTTISVVEIERRQEIGQSLGWASTKYLAILARGDRDACAYCDKPLNDSNRTIDHKKPKSRGGNNSIHNLVLACVPCNSHKGDRWEKPVQGTRHKKKILQPGMRKRCLRTCNCECHVPLFPSPHEGSPCPGKFIDGVPVEAPFRGSNRELRSIRSLYPAEADWNEGHAAIRRNHLGFPDP